MRRLALWGVVLALGALVGMLGVSTWSRHRPVESITLTAEEKSAFCVDVLNGNGRQGEASEVASHLRSLDYAVDQTLNAGRFDYPRTVVVDRNGNPRWARAVAASLGNVPVVQQRSDDGDCAIRIILGHDWSLEGQW